MTRPHTTTDRGYGWEHQQLRARLLPHAYGHPCPICGHTMLPGQALDLHHLDALAHGGGKRGPRAMAHAVCNRRDGQRIAQARTSRRRTTGARATARAVNSRAW